MFAGIADFVVRRHKPIVLAWVLVLLASLVLAPNINSVIQYNETAGAPTDLGSQLAQSYIDQHFGDSSAQPTTVIVLASPNVLSDEVKKVVMDLDGSIGNASRDGSVGKVSVTTSYSLAKIYTLNALGALNRAYNGANLTAQVVYGLPQDYLAQWQEVNRSAHALYTLPDEYAAAWSAANASAPTGTSTSVVDATAYASLREGLLNASEGLTAGQRALQFGWFDAFAQAWNDSGSLSGQPDRRADAAHAAAFAPFVEALAVPGEEKTLLVQVNESFSDRSVDFWNVTGFAQEAFRQNIATMTSSLGGEERALVSAYYDALTGWWNATGSEPSPAVYGAGVNAVAQSFGQSIADPTTRSTFLGIVRGGFSNYTDPAARESLLVGLVARDPFVAQQLAPRPWVIAAAGELGPTILPSALIRLSDQIVANSSLADFPIRMPADIIGMLVSPDNSTMLIALTYEPVAGSSAPGVESVAEVRSIVRSAVAGTSINAYVSGSDPITTDMERSTFQDLEVIEPITVVLVLVLIGLYFRSFVASSVPPMVMGLALGIAYGLVFLVGYFVMPIHYSVLTLLLTSMLGAGCDFCIFILSRYREERHNGRDEAEAVRQAVTWAGESIATSGATVIIGFVVLSLSRFSMIRSMGVSLALGATVALLVALTLLPALLVWLGDRMFWPARVDRPAKVRTGPGYFTRSARFSIKHAKVIVVAAMLLSIPTTYLVFSLDTSYDFIGSMPQSESQRGLAVVNSGFGGGQMTPTQIALEMNGSITSGDSFDLGQMRAIENVSAKLTALPNVKKVTSPTQPNGVPINYSDPSQASYYQAIMTRMISSDGRSALLTVVFVAEPFQKASIDSIQDLRAVAAQVEDPHIVKMYVGGATASMYDISATITGDFANMEVMVVIGIYVVLLVVLGSVLSPLRSILTILLSISWTLAATLLVFQYVLGQPILYMVPLILFIVCLGLGMDYDILLTTRVREEASKGLDDQAAIISAVERTGGIITACGIIMAAAFGSMMLSSGYLLKEFGFALMFAILLDATVVRIYLVPAIMSLLGKWNWWAPGPIKRIKLERPGRRPEAVEPGEDARTQQGK